METVVRLRDQKARYEARVTKVTRKQEKFPLNLHLPAILVGEGPEYKVLVIILWNLDKSAVNYLVKPPLD